MQGEQSEPTQGLGSVEFAVSVGMFSGLALGAIVDAVVLHHLLQWHYSAPGARHPLVALLDFRIETIWDGLFHTSTFVLSVGLVLSWRQERGAWLSDSRRLVAGSSVIGLGLFILTEGLINHHLLGTHHINHAAPAHQWLYWDLGFLALGAALMLAGAQFLRTAGPRVVDRNRRYP